MKIDIPPEAGRLIDRLRDNGFDAYVVGGCVRDSLLGKTPNDWDICTAATPDEVKRCLAGSRIIETGLKHGTVTAVTDGGCFEITTFRTEGGYSDFRRPDSVAFVGDVKEDLARRDFTMNAMAYNGSVGLVDPFGGVKSLSEKVISCVGKPDKRFREDALRILRALRFSSVFGFRIDGETSEAIHENKELLCRISAERISEELRKLLTGRDVLRVLLDYPDVFSTIVPELGPCVGFCQKSRYHAFDLWTHTARSVHNAVNDPSIRLAMLLHDIGKPPCFFEDENGKGHFYGHAQKSAELAEKRLKQMRIPVKEKELICTLIRAHGNDLFPTEKSIERWLAYFGRETFFSLLKVKKADELSKNGGTGRSRDVEAAESMARSLLEKEPCLSESSLDINGGDLKAAGAEGEEIGRIKKELLDLVIEGTCKNERSELLRYASLMLRK